MCGSFPIKLYRLSGSVCVHIRRYNLCFYHVHMDLYCGGVIIVACSLFLSMCLFVLVNAFSICVGEVTVLSLRVVVLL